MPAALAVDDALFGLVFSGVLVVVGVGVMRTAFERRRQRQLIAETPTEDIESLTLGPSEVKGVAEPVDAPLTAPFSDDDCVVAVWRVEQYERDSDDNYRWEEVASGVAYTPFLVNDGTGRLLVEPDRRVAFDLRDTDPVLAVRRGQEPPERVREFLDRRSFSPLESLRREFSLAPDVSFDSGGGFEFRGGARRGDRRYHQRLLRPGEDVYVFGTVQRREGASSARNPENLVVRRVPERDRDMEPLFLIADRPEAKLRSSRRYALLWFPVGALLTTVGLGGLAVVCGALLGVDLGLR